MNLPGELARLAEIAAPTAALLTQISMTHVGMFNSMAELIAAKLDLFRHMPVGAPLVVNAACPNTMAALAELEAEHPIVRFLGERMTVDGRPADIFISHVARRDPLGYRFDLNLPGGRREGLELKLFGRHHLANVAAAAALLHAAGLPPEWAAEALDDFRTEPLRGETVTTHQDTLILDCYNASPPSMLSSLASLTERPAPGRRVLVLADMLELGEHAAAAHAGLLGPLRRLAPALFFGLGPHCAALADALAREGWAARGFEKCEALIDALKRELRPGDQVFFKGSHGFGLERVAQAIAPEAFQ
jgi:UDP-N-acetylmuramoyl-tripeptide--D-alanyl-D-alanine ligase